MSNLQSLQILSSTFFLVYLPVSIPRGSIPIRSWKRTDRSYLGIIEIIYSSVFILLQGKVNTFLVLVLMKASYFLFKEYFILY